MSNSPPPTIGMIQGVLGFMLDCRACGRAVRVRQAVAIQMWGADATGAGICARAKCSACGGSEIGFAVIPEIRPVDMRPPGGWRDYWGGSPDWPELTPNGIVTRDASGR